MLCAHVWLLIHLYLPDHYMQTFMQACTHSVGNSNFHVTWDFPREFPADGGVSFVWNVKSDPQGSRARRPALSFSEALLTGELWLFLTSPNNAAEQSVSHFLSQSQMSVLYLYYLPFSNGSNLPIACIHSIVPVTMQGQIAALPHLPIDTNIRQKWCQ